MNTARRRVIVGYALLLCGACADQFVAPDAATTGVSLFDQVWEDADLHYSFFELRAVNWDSLRSVYRPRAMVARDQTEMAQVIGSLLRELHDPHVSFTPFGRGSTMRSLASGDTLPFCFSARRVFERYAISGVYRANERIRYARLDANVAYLQLPSFRGSGWAAEVDAALENIGDAGALVVDVRDNGGGTYALAVSIAGRFTASGRRFGYLRMRNGPGHADFTDFVPEVVRPAGLRSFYRPVFLLTNRRTISSAEVFTLALRSMPNVTVIGDTTSGASGGPTSRDLPNGWIYELSEWIEYSLRKKTYEAVGLAPDVYVPYVEADAARGVDPVLEHALVLAHASLLKQSR